MDYEACEDMVNMNVDLEIFAVNDVKYASHFWMCPYFMKCNVCF